MRQVLSSAAPLLLLAGSPALAQPADQSHEQHQQVGQNRQAVGEGRCCCEEEMRQMMMQMMKNHQGMKMPPAGADMQKSEPPTVQHQH